MVRSENTNASPALSGGFSRAANSNTAGNTTSTPNPNPMSKNRPRSMLFGRGANANGSAFTSAPAPRCDDGFGSD